VDSRGIAVRIAMVHSFYSSSQPSGENTVVLNEVDALRRAGHEVALFAAHTDELEGEVFYKLRSGLRVATGYGRNPLTAIKDFSPDVVHVHNLFPNLGRRWVNDVAPPIVHTLHNYRPLCANGLLFRDGRICTRCPDGDRLAGLRYGCYRDSRTTTLPLTVSQLRGVARESLLRRADRLIVLSPLQRDVYVRAGVPLDRMVLSPNYLPDAVDPGPRFERGSGFIGVGRLTPEKGFAALVEGWPNDVSLTIFGDGPDRETIERRGRDEVVLRGMAPREEVLRELRHAAGLVFPSRCYETFGLTAMESMACGTPVLASRGNSVAGLIDSHGGGSTTDWDAWGVAIAEFDFGADARRGARQVFEERFSEAAYRSRATALYEEVANARSLSAG
jgi:glycosyltransferase involved in cell wall biosynthesis